jgi:hypothetical protein
MITIPLDFIADRMISQSKCTIVDVYLMSLVVLILTTVADPDTGEVLYSNSIDCMRKVYHQQGLGVFWNTHSTCTHYYATLVQ